MDRLRTRALTSLVFTALLLLPSLSAMGQTTLEARPARKGIKRTFTINSTPPMATIYLDDAKYGVFGYTPFKTTLADGEYKLILELKGYKTEERNLRVQKGVGEQMVVLQREVAPGMIKVMASDPSLVGAQLSIDGQALGPTPRDAKLPVGRHLIEITKEGYQPFSQWTEIEEGQVVALAPVLKSVTAAKPMGSLLIDSAPGGAEVYVDGKRLADKTPTLADGLEDGIHLVEVSLPPGKSWKETVYVKAGERRKVTATLEQPQEPQAGATAGSQKGGLTASLLVKANVEGAEVFVDGERKGPAPLTLKDLPPGPHLLEVRAVRRATEKREMNLEGGKLTTVEFTLGSEVTASRTTGLVRVVSPQPEAEVFIDGAKAGVSPVEKELAAGKHFIMVRKAGFADFNREVLVVAGATVDLTANLLAGGGIRVIASRDGARVSLDGKPIGPSPAEANNVEAGEHVVSVELAGFEEYRSKVTVNGGERAVVNADLKEKYTGPTREELRVRQRAISTWGARPMAYGNFGVDVSAGYPVLLEARALVGVSDAKVLGWDLGVGLRTYFNNWEVFGTGRTRFFEAGPFSLGAFVLAGGGAGTAGRDTFSGQAGAIASLGFADVVTISGRIFADVWSDRLCPGADSDATGAGICTQDPATYSEDQRKRLEEETGLQDARELATKRDTGVRAYLSLAVEVAVWQNFSLFLVAEGAPAQGDRAQHGDLFNSTMFGKDPIYNGRLGATFKY